MFISFFSSLISFSLKSSFTLNFSKYMNLSSSVSSWTLMSSWTMSSWASYYYLSTMESLLKSLNIHIHIYPQNFRNAIYILYDFTFFSSILHSIYNVKTFPELSEHSASFSLCNILCTDCIWHEWL